MIFVLIWGLFMETVMGSVLRLVWPLGVSIYSYSYSYNSIWGLSGTQISGQSWVRSSLMANQGLYTTWGGCVGLKSLWKYTCLFVWFLCPKQQKTRPIEKYRQTMSSKISETCKTSLEPSWSIWVNHCTHPDSEFLILTALVPSVSNGHLTSLQCNVLAPWCP